jgi:hypothetical protein
MSDSPTPDSLQYRRRLAAERLLESSSWRDNLDDVQAQRLMNWAQRYVNNTVDETAVLSDEEAEEVIDEAVTAVLRVMRDVNQLTPQFSELDEESRRRQLQKFSDNCESVLLSPIPVEEIEQILNQHQSWQPSETFEALFQILTPPPDKELPEEEE